MPKRSIQTTVLDGNFENISTCHRDNMHKSYLSSDYEDTIPVPIQIFLWRQSSPFLKQKFGNLTEASAIIFDRVLVQNILHGLSPCLTDAISSIPRWLLMKAAFPHVIHACSSVIEHNLGSVQMQQQPYPPIHSSLVVAPSQSHSSTFSTQLQIPSNHPLSISLNPTMNSTEYQRNQSYLTHRSSTITNHLLDSTEIRLFHTLHYLILHSNETNDQPLSLNTIQLFIYLFIPYIHTYLRNNEKEFLSNSDLSQGMRLIWQPLFEYHRPNVRIFNAFVKPIVLTNNYQESRVSIDNNNQHHCLPVLIQSPIQRSSSEKQHLSGLKKQLSLNVPINSNETTNTNCFQLEIKTEEKQKSHTSILTDSNATTTYNSIADLSVYEVTDNDRQKQAPLVNMNSICSASNLSRVTLSLQSPG
ncbi:unnamed protein product [Rotaria sp. Silwood1]|nr:unnamed protein product [Rotaria sp. Silwood1]CAF0992481.1 unnamed protein product [Rotaria sp. Silwood1]CAF3405486.1 unnamed protein product [Rotaria sp. Silwood1]CAF4869998.1 unnamed protein product [Rotaria sp. Silwood1]